MIDVEVGVHEHVPESSPALKPLTEIGVDDSVAREDHVRVVRVASIRTDTEAMHGRARVFHRPRAISQELMAFSGDGELECSHFGKRGWRG